MQSQCTTEIDLFKTEKFDVIAVAWVRAYEQHRDKVVDGSVSGSLVNLQITCH